MSQKPEDTANTDRDIAPHHTGGQWLPGSAQMLLPKTNQVVVLTVVRQTEAKRAGELAQQEKVPAMQS